MKQHQPEKPNIVFLFSDTGGGHRSAAEAIIEALELEFPDRISVEMIDFFRSYAPPPLDAAPEIYPKLVRVPDIWHFGYQLSDGRHRSRLVQEALLPYIGRAIRRLDREHPSDLIVSVHPLANGPVIRNLKNRKQKFITVVTDLVSVHALWYDSEVDTIIVPTEIARQRGIDYGCQPNRFEVVGLPVADRFCQPLGDQNELKKQLGLPHELPVVLLVGGGDGMGPLAATAQAIHHAELPVSMVIITGRNKKLKKQLENIQWKIPAFIHGFVKEMPTFMRAADFLVTKAGPGTICEAFIAGLPIILYSRFPGQEDGNVSYVVNEGAGVWAPDPEMVVNILQYWLNNPKERENVTQSSFKLARPDAARLIARILASHVGITL